MGVHACGSKIKAIAFLEKADGCGHNKMPPCHRALMEGCCHDQQITHEAQELKKEVTTNVLPIQSASDLVHTPVVLSALVPPVVPSFSPRLFYSPPERTTDIIVLHEVFLI